ncbi:MAG: DMT family transporter, partial [Solirubrobacteraceae bacterium]
AWAAFAVMSVVWGGSYLLIKIAVDGGMPALDLAWLRIAMAAAILAAIAWRRGTLATLRGRWRWILAYAVAEMSVPFPLIAAGEVHVASSLAAIIIAAVPLLVTVISLRVDPSERPTPLRAAGLAIGFVGVVALVGIDVAGSSEELLGALAVLGGAVGYAIGPIVLKLGMDGIDARVAMGASLVLATILLAPLAIADAPVRTPTLGAIAAVVALGVVCTALAFVVYTMLVREAGTGRATIITYVNPLVAVVLGMTLLGERPGPYALGGLGAILAGSWLATGGRLPRRRLPSGPAPGPPGGSPGGSRAPSVRASQPVDSGRCHPPRLLD